MRSTASTRKGNSLASAPRRCTAWAGLLLSQISLASDQTQAPAGWSVRDLNPPNASSWVSAVGETMQLGTISKIIDLEGGPMGPVTDDHTGYWRGTRESFLDLMASGTRYARIWALAGDVLAGDFVPATSKTGDAHAGVWTSLSAPVIDLHPAGYLLSGLRASNGQQHVGYANVDPYNPASVSVPMLWTGTSAAGVELPLPPGATSAWTSALSATQQGGAAAFGRVGSVFQYSTASHAILWNGSSGRVVDLHPSGATDSTIRAMTDDYQAGEVNYTADLNQSQAALWFGSPSSLRILAAPRSSLRGASGPYQVGTTMVNGQPHATLWMSSASSAVDLHPLLPAGFISSSADSIWTDGTKIMIGGSASRPGEYGSHAMIWSNTPASLPIFTSAPQSLTVATGSSFALTASATANSDISFQWQRDGANIPGATGTTRIDNQPGVYTVVATTSAGSITSPAAVVSPLDTDYDSRLTNISIRAVTGPGADTLILGATIPYPAGKLLLIRAAGPALSAFGLTGLLPDPMLTIFRNGTAIATNDNWNAEPVATWSTRVGAFPFMPGSLDAALVIDPPEGDYSIHVTGKDGATGLVLAELYEATMGAPDLRHLTNLSVRTRLTPSAKVAIAGFVINGDTAKTVLLRAIGPGLSPLGVPDGVADPRLRLFAGAMLLCENDDWGGDPALAWAGRMTGAFPLASPSSKDATVLVTLPPGTYTAQVSAAENNTGAVLLEVYDVP